MNEASDNSVRVPNVLEDPSIKVLAKVYADAYLDAKGDQSGEERVEELSSFVEDVLNGNPAFEKLLVSPMIDTDEKLASLQRAVIPHASPVLGNFLKVVASHDRLELLRVISDVVVEEQQHRAGKEKVVVRSATEIPEHKLNDIRHKLAEFLSAEPVLELKIDPDLLGGLVIQVGDTVYDSSLKNRLEQLQSQLRQRYIHEIQSGRNRFSHPEGS